MSQQESSSAEQQVLQVQRQRQVPIFEPIDGDDARARAAVEQWRTFTMLLEPQVWRSRRIATVFEKPVDTLPVLPFERTVYSCSRRSRFIHAQGTTAGRGTTIQHSAAATAAAVD